MGEVLGPSHLRYPRGAGPAGVPVVHAVHVRQQDQQIGVDQVGDERGEAVVVAEADLVRGDRVVLVDDRERAHRQELVEGAGCVAVMGAATGVVGGEQHLADTDAVAGAGGGVTGHQQALADTGRGLLPGQVPGAAAQSEGARPAAIAPEETRTISFSPPLRCLASTSTSASTRSASSPPAAVVSEEEPTLTTIR
ncbi:hypothetical protein MBT84_28270 [Streptomyces sp. MBT84]|nr:hypothetical protein [Streptomyces sp. MBT84]